MGIRFIRLFILFLSGVFVFIALVCNKKPAPENKNSASDSIRVYKVIVKPTLVFRSKPSLSSKKIDKLYYDSRVIVLDKNGPELTVLGLSGRWYKIRQKQKTGWVFGPFIAPVFYSGAPYIIKNGVAVQEAIALIESDSDRESDDNLRSAPRGAKLCLFTNSLDGHDISNYLMEINEKTGNVKHLSCSYWSGPPHNEESNKRHCETSESRFVRKKDHLLIGGEKYYWHARAGGFISRDDENDWETILGQAFGNLEHPEGLDWTLDKDNCRFTESGGDDNYGAKEVTFLCGWAIDEGSCYDDNEEWTNSFKTSE